MKKKKVLLIVICLVMAVVCACAGVGVYFWQRSVEWPGEAQKMDIYTDFQKPQNLPEGNGKRVKVILLLGQSNGSIHKVQYDGFRHGIGKAGAREIEGDILLLIIEICIECHCDNDFFCYNIRSGNDGKSQFTLIYFLGIG